MLELVEQKCLCGKLATAICHDVWPPGPLIPCNAPICHTGCPGHRHDDGTMGYPAKMKGSTRWYGYEPDGPGFWNWVKAMWATFMWSAQKKADKVWEEQLTWRPPPAPFPILQLQIGSRCFESRGEHGMVEVQEWSETPRFDVGPPR